MTRYLVVCSQTLGSDSLLDHLEKCRAAGPSSFHVVVPAVHQQRGLTWTEGGDRAVADRQLRYALGQLGSLGFDVTGEVGDPSPVTAIGHAVSGHAAAFDEIVLCTLPQGVSRRVGQDLPRRVERSCSVPVRHVVATLTRTYGGHEIPQAGTYIVDRSPSKVGFVVPFVKFSRVRGRFGEFSGTLCVGEAPEDSSVGITINAASISTGIRRRDSHLRNADFFDIERHPTMSFSSSRVAPQADQTWKVRGDLTMLGVTRTVDLDVEFCGVEATQWGEQRAGFSAVAEIDRRQWGLTWKRPFKLGGLLIGRKIRIELDVQAVRTVAVAVHTL